MLLGKKDSYKINKAKDKGRDVTALAEKIGEMTLKHIEVLQGLLTKVPEQAREHIQHAIEMSSRSRAVESITKEKPVDNSEKKPEGQENKSSESNCEKKSSIASLKLFLITKRYLE